MIQAYKTNDIPLLKQCRLPITPLVTEFYLLERLRAECKPSFSPAQNTLSTEIHMTYDRFADTFAHTLRDYLVLICAGEARHAGSCKCGMIREIPQVASTPNVDQRNVIYEKTVNYDPIVTLSTTAELFGRFGWEGSVGGMQWHSIANWGLQYGKVSNQLFCDVVMTLQHNNSNVFGKPVMFDLDNSLGIFLNTKMFNDLLEWPLAKGWTAQLLTKHYSISSDTLWLLKRAARVGIIQQYREVWADIDTGSRQYALPEVVWGDNKEYTLTPGRWNGIRIPDMFKEAGVPMPAASIRVAEHNNVYWQSKSSNVPQSTDDTGKLPKTAKEIYFCEIEVEGLKKKKDTKEAISEPKQQVSKKNTIPFPAWMLKKPIKQTLADTPVSVKES